MAKLTINETDQYSGLISAGDVEITMIRLTTVQVGARLPNYEVSTIAK